MLELTGVGLGACGLGVGGLEIYSLMFNDRLLLVVTDAL